MMDWFKFPKKKDEDSEEGSIFVSEVPVSTMVRWFVYDIGYGKDGVDTLLGLAPMSEEGMDKEAEDSKSRVNSLYPILSFLDLMSDAAANIFSTIAMGMEQDIPEDEREEMEEVLGNLYKSVALSALLGSFSVANALGLIDITAFSSNLEDMEDNYDE